MAFSEDVFNIGIQIFIYKVTRFKMLQRATHESDESKSKTLTLCFEGP